MQKIHTPWDVKYNPKSISDVIFANDSVAERFKSFVEQKSIPNHLMLVGHRGAGKTALSHALVHDLGVRDSDFLEINGSDESGIDTVRERIVRFTNISPMESEFKVLLLEEFDHFSKNAQAALRKVMDYSVETTKFIITGNYTNKILPEIMSRCEVYTFSALPKLEMVKRGIEILKAEGVKVDSPDYVKQLLDSTYPDMRKFIISLEQSTVAGVLKPDVGIFDVEEESFVMLLESISSNDLNVAKQFISENVSENIIVSIYSMFFDYVEEIANMSNGQDKREVVRKLLITLSKFMDMQTRTPMPQITFMGMVASIMEIVHGQ